MDILTWPAVCRTCKHWKMLLAMQELGLHKLKAVRIGAAIDTVMNIEKVKTGPH